MIKIYKLVPEPNHIGSFENGILEINGKKFETTEKNVLDSFNRGYWRCGKE